MDHREAERSLEGQDLVACVQAGIPDAKRLLQQCLDEDIPAVLGRDSSCTTGSCSPRVQLFVRQNDVERVAKLMRTEWLELVGDTLPVGENGGAATAKSTDPNAEPPCPCCGTAAPLIDGCCSDCGLHLA